jgi:integrase
VIGKARGLKGTFPVYIYDAAKRRKIYVGSRPTRREAKILEGEKTRELGQPAKPTGTHTVASYVDRFFTVHHTVAKKRGEPTTLTHNRQAIKPFLAEYGQRALGSITKAEAGDWASGHPRSARSVKAMFAEAFREDACPVDPFANVRLPNAPGRSNIDPLTEAEIEKLGEIAIRAGTKYGPELWAFIMFAAWTGMRPGEICALDWAEVYLDRDIVRVEWNRRNDGTRGPVKTKRRREIVLAAQARQALLSLHRTTGPVFRSPTGKPLRPNTIRTYWRPVRDGFTAQLPDSHWLRRRLIANPNDRLDPYECRHFCGSMLADRGLSAWDIAYHLGNSPKVCEEVYIHVHAERVQSRLRAAFDADSSGSLEQTNSAPAPMARPGA